MPRTLVPRVDPTRLRSLVVAAALVGLVAGLAAATFAYVAGEPAIEQAIAIEDANASAHADDGGHHDEASVSRTDQRSFGLFGAYALTGAAFGGLLALTAYGLRRGRPDVGRRILLAGVILAGALTVAPWLKYPPNPPAVGDPGTLGERQSLYVAVIVIAAVVGVVATMLHRRLVTAGWAETTRIAAVASAITVPMVSAFALLPPAPDAVAVPATLVWRFRLASLGANLTLWAVLSIGLAWLSAPPARAVPTRDTRREPTVSVI